MVFQGLGKPQADAVWQPFLDWVAAAPNDFTFASPPRIVAIPARHLWDAEYLRANLPSVVLADDRAGAPASNVFWVGNLGEAGQFLHGYESTWLAGVVVAGEPRRSASPMRSLQRRESGGSRCISTRDSRALPRRRSPRPGIRR